MNYWITTKNIIDSV